MSLSELEPATLARSLSQVRSVKDALTLAESNRDKYPSLAVLRRNYGSEAVEDIIMLYLADLRDNVNLTRPLRDAQIELIANEIVSKFYSLTIADVHVVFRKAKTGEYAPFYEGLDMPKVTSWFNEYFDDRCAMAESISISNQFNDKGGNLTPERMTEYFDNLEKQSKKINK